MVTANWSIVSNESSFEKKEESGYLVFSKNGTFSIIYNKKDPKEEGYMSPEVVNSIIEDMRKVVKKFLDVDLKAVYTVAE